MINTLMKLHPKIAVSSHIISPLTVAEN